MEAKYGTYQDVFASLFQRAIDSDPYKTQALYVEAYDVVQGDYPTSEALSQCQGVLLTGSGGSFYARSGSAAPRSLMPPCPTAASAYDSAEWVHRLIAFTASLPEHFPLLKIIGVRSHSSLHC